MKISRNCSYWFYLCLLSLFPTLAYAHTGGLAIGFFVLIFSGGLAIVIAVIAISIIGFKGASGLKQMGAGVVVWVLAFALIASLTIFAWQKSVQNERESRVSAMQLERDNATPRSRDSDLKQVACDDDINKIRAELAKNKHSRRDAIIAYEDCAVAHVNVEIADLLLKQILISAGLASRNAHCPYLTPVFRQIGKRIDLQLLALFTKRKLSLDCLDESERDKSHKIPTWWKETQATRAMTDPNYAAYLVVLQSAGVKLDVDLGGRNLLSYAFSYGHADTIALLLNEQSLAFHASPAGSEWTALQYWILRQHAYHPPSVDGVLTIPKLSEREIKALQAQLPELTQDEINFIDGAGRRFNGWSAMPDGGAALFRYLRVRGMQLHIPNQESKGLFEGGTPLSPALLRELDQLSDVQLRELSCKKNHEGTVKISLYTDAKMEHNMSIVNYLEKRKVTTC
ncbi:MAG: hypothetical protein K2P84_08820 [Undibacterium sp.]|nr:hypothetical protein [Undibacterium sp.]